MKLLINLCILILFSNIIYSQTGTIKGTLHDKKTNLGIDSVIICIFDIKYKTITNKDGYFELKNIPVGTYNLFGSKKNVIFDNLVEKINIVSDTLIELVIKYPRFNVKDINNKRCPICNKDDEVVEILYGKPNKAAEDAVKQGRAIFGGCYVILDNENSLYWYCKRDDIRF